MKQMTLAFFVLVFLTTAVLGDDKTLFPRPAELERDVQFWIRIYTGLDTNAGFIHDSQRLDVIYDVVRFDRFMSRSVRQRKVDQVKEKYRKILKTLAGGKREGLTSTERRVLDMWGARTNRNQLHQAANQLRFQLGQADRFKAGLVRSARWEGYIRRTLRDMGLPTELAALPHVESSYNPGAYSHAGAAGLWQFTRGTGRRYMRVDHLVDERLDPYHSSEAAARLLEYNHSVTGNWPLAITAYNHGAAGVRRAVRELGTRDIARIVRHYQGRNFGFASRNFYVAFLAALEVSQNATKYFGQQIKRAQPLDMLAIELPAFIKVETLVQAWSIDRDLLKDYNRALLGPIWEGKKLVPKGFVVRLPQQSISGTASDLIASLPATTQYLAQIPDQYYKVQRGDTLSHIAARNNTTIRELASYNGLRNQHRIRVGQRLRLPNYEAELALMQMAAVEDAVPETRSSAVASAQKVAQKLVEAEIPEAIATEEESHAEQQNDPEPVAASQDTDVHTAEFTDANDYSVADDGTIEVQAAETLGHYAEWLGLRANQLRRINGMRYGQPVVIGTRLRLDFSEVSMVEFERLRLSYHKNLQETFFAEYQIDGTQIHNVRSGDSLWVLSHRTYGIPIWLLRQYNPDLSFDSVLPPGMAVTIPQVNRRVESPQQQATVPFRHST